MNPRLVLLALLAMVVACGASVTPRDGGPGTTRTDAGTDAGGTDAVGDAGPCSPPWTDYSDGMCQFPGRCCEGGCTDGLTCLGADYVKACDAPVFGYCGDCDDPDHDGDGHAVIPCCGDDCDDTDPGTHPGVDDVRGDCIDRNCDGSDAIDLDGDGFDSIASGGTDCDDADPIVFPGSPAERWSHHVLGEAWWSGQHPSIAFDPDGVGHVVYRDRAGGVRHAELRDGAWNEEEIDAGGWGDSATIGVDTEGTLHVMYDAPEDLFHAYRRSGEIDWTVEVAIEGGSWQVSAALDSGNAVHVVWVSRDLSVLRYATNGSGAWVAEDVGSTGSGPAIAVDADADVHVAWFAASGEVTYARRDLMGWTSEPLELAGRGDVAAIAVDATGTIDVAWVGMRLANGNLGAWTMETVVEDGWQPSILPDPDGSLHIAHMGGYATNATGAWVSETVDVPHTGAPSITRDGDGGIRIAYATEGEVRVARRAEPNGIDEDCDGVAY